MKGTCPGALTYRGPLLILLVMHTHIILTWHNSLQNVYNFRGKMLIHSTAKWVEIAGNKL
jgi:hypothetical protein